MAPRIEGLTARWNALFKDMGSEPIPVDLDNSRRWASAVARGSIFFYETQEVPIGVSDIDWSGRHIAHQEWPAQLNRFFCLRHLVNCHTDDHDLSHARHARLMISDWIKQHDYAADRPMAAGDNTLNLSIRLGQTGGRGWWPAIAEFGCADVFNDTFIEEALRNTAGQLAYLRAHITPKGNWRISQLDTFLTCSLLWPDELGEYREFAVRNLNETFHRQIHADGSHEEHNPSYHGWMCDVFTALWRLAKARPDLGLVLDDERVVRMWDYRLASMAPDGGSWGIHDGGVWTSANTAKSSSFLAQTNVAGMAARRNAVVAAAAASPERWEASAQPSRYFESAGQLYLRAGFDPRDEMLSFDATRWGGGHCHLSRNAITFFSRRMLLCDPGIFNYEVSDPFMSYGKSTPAHNTLHIDFMSQTEADPHVLACDVADDCAVFCSAYEGGYFPGEYSWGWYTGKHPGICARHTRTLLWLRNRFAIVWDVLHCDDAGARAGINWQFPVGPAHCDPATGRGWTAEEQERNILVQRLSGNTHLSTALQCGNYMPKAGWLPKDYMGGHLPAPQLHYQGQMHSRYLSTSFLLLPFDGTTPPALKTEPLRNAKGDAEGATIDWPDGTRDVIIAAGALAAQIGEAPGMETDASLVVITLRDGKPIHTVGYGGMYLEYGGRTLMSKRDTRLWSRNLA